MPRLSRRALLGAAATGLLAGCAAAPPAPAPGGTPSSAPAPTPPPGTAVPEPSTVTPVPAATMAERATVPVLCYHQIREWAPGDSAYSRSALICPPDTFRRQLDGIAEAGWTTITPDAYLDHLTARTPLPEKPVLITFDDGKDSQPLVAAPELARRGMSGVFFVMTVVIGKAGWISERQVAELADQGHVVGSHTWDHQNVTKYGAGDWSTQFEESRATLRELSRQPVATFAYPYGAWNEAALPHLAAAGYTMAFQLADHALLPTDVPHTLQRILVDSRWDGAAAVAALEAFRTGAA